MTDGPETLNAGTVVIDSDGDAWQNDVTGYWRSTFDETKSWSELVAFYGPVRVVWTPEGDA